MNETAEATAAINEALAAAQSEFPPIPREKTVTVRTREGGSYSFAYAPLDAILTAVRPALADHGLAVTQQLATDLGDRPSLRTELRHAEGGMISASFPLPTRPENPQALGSLLTYLRRYAIVALLGIATEEDDDGNAAAGNEIKTAARPTAGPSESAPPSPSGFQAPPLRTDASGAMPITDPQRKKIYAVLGKLKKAEAPGFTDDAVRLALSAHYGTESISELTRAQAGELIDRLSEREQHFGLVET